MVAPGLLNSPDLLRWLDSVEPAWTVLEFDSFNALHDEPSATNRAIRLEPHLTAAELSNFAAARATLLLLRRAADSDGLKLTATGNLSRSVVEEMCGLIEWPNYDKVEMLRYNRVVNEPDFLPLHFVRVLTIVTKLTRAHRGKLVLTPLGRSMIGEGKFGALNALLFHMTFWHLNLAYFDRFPLESWPQTRIGIVLWSLSASADDWLPPERLSRLCAVPVNGVLESTWDLGSSLMEIRVLRPLVWFGLLDSLKEGTAGSQLADRRLYRKTPLYDLFLNFSVQVERPDVRH